MLVSLEARPLARACTKCLERDSGGRIRIQADQVTQTCTVGGPAPGVSVPAVVAGSGEVQIRAGALAALLCGTPPSAWVHLAVRAGGAVELTSASCRLVVPVAPRRGRARNAGRA